MSQICVQLFLDTYTISIFVSRAKILGTISFVDDAAGSPFGSSKRPQPHRSRTRITED